MEPLALLVIMWCGVFFAGAVLVNVGILPKEAHPFIRGFAEIGIIVIMFAIGFEAVKDVV